MRLRTIAAFLAIAAGVSALMCAGRTGLGGGPTSAAAPTPVPVLAPPTAVPGEPKTTPGPAVALPAATTADLFGTAVRPVLRARCAPCHEPGGALYERLPFDRPETLASHRDGALKRLKGDDRAAFEAWLKTLP
jgi:hypothetical protein